MTNIKFSYLYRDAGNYKSYGEVIFDNPNNITRDSIEQLVIEKLIDGQWFYAKEWLIPELHQFQWDHELDHGFHEFDYIEYTNQPAITTIDNFLQLVEKTNWIY